MKFFVFVSFFLLQLVVLVSSSLTELIFELIVLSDSGKQESESRINSDYRQIITQLNSLLVDSGVPAINDVNNDIEQRIQFLENLTANSGYDFSTCIAVYRKNLASTQVPNLVERARQELREGYELIASDASSIGVYNVDVISRETNSLTNDYFLCLNSEDSSLCKRSLTNRISAKIEGLPVLFEKEIQTTNLNLLEQVVNYEVRIQEYVQQYALATKHFSSLFESCVTSVLVRGS